MMSYKNKIMRLFSLLSIAFSPMVLASSVFYTVTISSDSLAAETDRYFLAGDPGNDSAWANTSGGTKGAGVPSSTCDVFYDANGNNACTLTADTLFCKSMSIASGYTATWNDGGKIIKVDGPITINSGGAITSSGKFIQTSVGNLAFNCTGTATITSDLIINSTGAENLDITKQNWRFKDVTMASSAVITYTGAGSGAGNYGTLYKNGTFIIASGKTWSTYITTVTNPIQNGTNDSIRGPGTLTMYGNNTSAQGAVVVSVPKLKIGYGANIGTLTFTKSNSGKITYSLTDTISADFINFFNQHPTDTMNFLSNGKVINGLSKMGSNVASTTQNFYFSTSPVTLLRAYTSAAYNSGVTKIYFDTSSWTVPLSWTHNSSSVVFPSASTHTITGTSTITSAGQQYHDFIINNSGAGTVKTADSLSATGNIILTDGRDSISTQIRCDTLKHNTTDSVFYCGKIYCNVAVFGAGIKPYFAPACTIVCATCDGVTNTWGGTLPIIRYPNVGSISFTSTPFPDTVGKAANHIIAYTPCTPDSVRLISGTLPDGLTFNNVLWRVAGTPTTVTAKTPITFRAYNNSGTSTSDLIDTFQVISSADSIPVIDSIRPTHGTFNTQVTVRGTTFGSAPSGYLNGGLVPYVSRDSVSYVFNATDLGLNGIVPFVIKNNTYNTYDTINWSYDTIPTLISITPSHSKLAPTTGQLCSLVVTNGSAVDSIRFGTVLAKNKSKTETLIVDTIPVSAASGKKSIFSFARYGYLDTLLNAFEYKNVWLTSVTSKKAYDTATLRAEYGLKTSGLGITVGDSTATVIAGYSDTTARFIVPGYKSGTYKLLATNSDGDTCSIDFMYPSKGSKSFRFGWGFGF